MKIRLYFIPIIVILMLLFPIGLSATNAEVALDVELSNYAYYGGDYDGVDHAAKSVFYVEAYKSGKKETGSGFAMFNECLLITNQHVINEASYLRITDDYGDQYIIDQVVVSDKEHDIAILYFPEGIIHYDPLEYDAAFSNLKRMQSVIAIGSPEGLTGTISDGIISGFRLFRNSDIRYIQITAPISHGSSGGCLLNEDLKVIGVTSSGVEKGENLNFAIPIFIVERLYQQWNKKDTVQLGTEESWDTVGHGLHERISGKTEKPKDDSTEADDKEATVKNNNNEGESTVLSNYGYIASPATLRREPYKEADRIRLLETYAFCMVKEKKTVDGELWYNIDYNGDVGFVMGEFFHHMTMKELNDFLSSEEYQQGILNNQTATQEPSITETPNPVGVATIESELANEPTPVSEMEKANSSNEPNRYKQVGDTVLFGHYEQDNNIENGMEEIEWIVLDVQDGKSLLLSKYGLDAIPYNRVQQEMTWENSSLRKWLNNDFLYEAFTTRERAAILMTQVDNSSAQCCNEWNTIGGNNTQDKIFLLSCAEANQYLNVTPNDYENMESRASSTVFAKAKGFDTGSTHETEFGDYAEWWWLRSPGVYQDCAACVIDDGSLYDLNIDNPSGCVRPAFWLNLESDPF